MTSISVEKIVHKERVDKSGNKTRVYNFTCPRSGVDGTAAFSQMKADGKTFWHINSVSDGFNHNEMSLGGAEIWCACPTHREAKLVCDPNHTAPRDPDD